MCEDFVEVQEQVLEVMATEEVLDPIVDEGLVVVAEELVLVVLPVLLMGVLGLAPT